MSPRSRPEFAGKSESYINGWLHAEAAIYARPPAAPPMRNDVAPTISRGEFREDAAPRPPMVPAALRAKANLMNRECHVRMDDALNRAGLVSHADRDAETRRAIAQVEAARHQWHVDQNRKLIAAGHAPLRLDSADAPLSGAAAARLRMTVRQDQLAWSRPEAAPEPDYRADAAPGFTRSSAAAAKKRLNSERR